ncbi:MAG: PPC domain-containing protein [Acidobacteria bacterium]|nr:PPC domain-containing protein [Acidobacteriota bacterium]
MKLLALFLTLVAWAAAEDTPKAKVRHRLPALSSVFPQGSEPGRKLRVEALGEYLDRAQAVVFLDPAISGRVLESTYTRLELEFEVAAGAALGPHYFRVVTPRGASSLLLFRIGDQPHRLEHEPNDSLEQAEEVPLPVTLNGRLNVDGDFDFYRFRAEQGQTWIFDLRAARNGNGLDAAMILLDAEGRRLEHSEDKLIWDPFFTHTFAKSGQYYVVVQPTHRSNDPNFAYQLDIRQAPHLETVSPISLTPGAAAEATVFGAGLAGERPKLWFDAAGFEGDVLEMRGASARVKIRVPREARCGPHQIAIETAAGRSNPATFLVDDTPVHKGGESIEPPVSITGVARYRQPERFSFEAKEGQSLVFEVRAQRFGSPVDSILRILDAKGNQVALNDDANFAGVQFNKDSRISHTFKQAGRYVLEMRNLWAVTGEDFPYQLLVRPPQPGFELMLASDQPYVYPGETGTLKVTAVRRDGFDGPIKLNVTGLPAGITAEPVEIPSKKNDAEIHFRADGAKPGTYAQIQTVGEQPAWRSVRISSGGGEGATFARVDQVTIAVVEKPRFALEAASTTVNLVRGGSAEVMVQIERGAEGMGEIRFWLENLPIGVTADAAVAPADAKNVRIRLRASQQAPRGRASRVAILGSGDRQVQEAPRISIVVD